MEKGLSSRNGIAVQKSLVGNYNGSASVIWKKLKWCECMLQGIYSLKQYFNKGLFLRRTHHIEAARAEPCQWLNKNIQPSSLAQIPILIRLEYVIFQLLAQERTISQLQASGCLLEFCAFTLYHVIQQWSEGQMPVCLTSCSSAVLGMESGA